MELEREHAVVIGGSIAGLLAASVLARHYRRVTLVDRDRLDVGYAPRKGAPQSHQLHFLLASGCTAIEALLPGFRRRAKARGAHELDIGDIGILYLLGQRMPKLRTGQTTLTMSRPLLEGILREQVLALANVVLLDRTAARGLLGSRRRVTGVRLDEGPLAADLVLDASGRGSQLHRWLGELGVRAPREEVYESRVTYSGVTIRRKPQHLGGERAWMMTPTAPETRFGAAQRIEGERFIVALSSYLGTPGATTYDEFIEHARRMRLRGLDALLADAEPCSEPKQMQDPVSRFRRYDRLARFPAGLLVLGDALCNFNPAYGQGMSVAALEALALDACLARGDARLSRRYFSRAAEIIDAPWTLATGGDIRWPEVKGERTLAMRLINLYVARAMTTAASNEEVARVMVRVMHLLDPPRALLAPSVAWAVLRQSRTLRSEASSAAATSSSGALSRTS